jgi:hypothetical protein
VAKICPTKNKGWPNHGHAKFIGQNMGKNFWIALGWMPKHAQEFLDSTWLGAKTWARIFG